MAGHMVKEDEKEVKQDAKEVKEDERMVNEDEKDGEGNKLRKRKWTVVVDARRPSPA